MFIRNLGKNYFSGAQQVNLQALLSRTNLAMSNDNYKVQLGLMIQRDPIFLKYSDTEMEVLKQEYLISIELCIQEFFFKKKGKKLNLEVPLAKDLYQFKFTQSELPSRTDDTPTHLMIDEETKEKSYYRGNSKFFKYVGNELCFYNEKQKKIDPTISDRKSIQYASLYTVYLLVKSNNRWFFPISDIVDKTKFKESKQAFFSKISNNKWEVFHLSRFPRLCLRDESEEQSRIKGTKTFFFQAQHIGGVVSVNEELYEDFAWVPKLEMNQYLNEYDFNRVINALDL